ncbi:MAG: nucleotidyltransferase family protein [Balneolales bacterium]
MSKKITYSDPPLADILLCCLHQDQSLYPSERLANLTAGQWQALVELAGEHRVVPLLYERLMALGIPDVSEEQAPFTPALENLQAYSHQVARNNLGHYGEISKLLRRANQKGIPTILLKGIYLAEGIYKNPGLREMNDIDVLFQCSDLKKAFMMLTDMGYSTEKPIHFGKGSNIDKLISQSHHLPPMVKPHTAKFEIHWNISHPAKAYSIEPKELWERAETVTVAGEKAMMLTPEDNLLHLCIHTSYQHMFSFGIRPFCDIAEMMRHFGSQMNWDAFIERAFRYRWDRGVFLSLVIARDFTGAAIPLDVFERLQPDGYDPLMAETAKAQIFTDKATSGWVSSPIINFATGKNVGEMVKAVLIQIFLPQTLMTKRYPVQPGSLMLYAYYGVRCWQVLLRHTVGVLRLSRGDAYLLGIVRRKKKLNQWMNAEL